jgi:hypothetical protein
MQPTELAPDYRIPSVILAIAALLTPLSLWASALLALFGAFLMIQAIILRLQFTDTALDIYRGKTLIRSFPFSEWQHWEIFWSPVPILLYFRETKSIHFLPIIFDSIALRQCLEAKGKRIEKTS